MKFQMILNAELFPPVSWRTVGTPYVGMAPKKNGGHINSAQMTRSNRNRGGWNVSDYHMTATRLEFF